MKLRKSAITMLLSPLLLLLASPLAHAYSGYYYVIPSSAPLRECPANECAVLHTAYQHDKVEILERTETGWSKVRFVDRPTGWGWIRSNLLSYSQDLTTRPEPPYYVNTGSLAVHDQPTPNSAILTTLHLNDPVEMLGVSHSGWAQVRDLGTSITGWVPPRFLSASPVGYNQPTRRRRAPKPAPKEEQEVPPQPKPL